jgi:predicted Zn-dependent protease
MHKLFYPMTVFLLASSLFASDPFAGTWKLNLAKSTFGGLMAPPKELIFVFQEQGEQGFDTMKGVAADGSPIYYKDTFTNTGGESKILEGVGAIGVLAKRSADSRTRDWTIMQNNKVIATDHDVVSEDGKTTQMIMKGTDAQGNRYEVRWVFDRMAQDSPEGRSILDKASQVARNPNMASITVDSAPLYSKMSTTSPVVVVLHKGDAVTINFSIAASDGDWCSVTQAGQGGKSGDLPCNSVQRDPVVPPSAVSKVPAAAPAALTLPTARASHVPRAPPNVRVYFVPIGSLAVVDVQYLIRYYQQRFGLTITPLTGIALDNRQLNSTRQQYQAEGLIQSLRASYPTLANDGRSVLIGITEADIYTTSENWYFALGLRGPRVALVSSARMDLNHSNFGAPSDPVGLHSRLTKMVSREIGFIYYGLPVAPDPRSVVRSSILGVDELDELGEDF